MTALTDDEEKAKMDPVQNAMGPLGKWHIIVCGVIFLLKFPVAWHQMSIIFLAPPIEFSCITDGGTVDTSIDKCSDKCIGREYNRSIFTETIITEWDLVCQKSQFANISQTLFMFGILIGNVFFGTIADK